MIDYYEALSGAEQAQVSESIRLLYRQTFLLERTYDRKSKRYQTSPGILPVQPASGIYPELFCHYGN